MPLALTIVALGACAGPATGTSASPAAEPPERPADRWALYSLDLGSGETELIYSTESPIEKMRVDPTGDTLAFSQAVGGDSYERYEIFTIGIDGQGRRQLTDNDVWDLYPSWSPDGSTIAFLSKRGATLDIYAMAADGSDQRLLYDSGDHDADIHWQGDMIAFTSGSRIWVMNADGTDARAVTDPPRAGEWGDAVLPFGDYDPRISPDGTQIVFSRLVDDESSHGNYDLFVTGIDGTDVTRLTDTGYTQGVADWSHDGTRLIYILAAVGDEGRYDIYMMNADGTDNHIINPASYPDELVIHFAVLSPDDSRIYFVGEWW